MTRLPDHYFPSGATTPDLSNSQLESLNNKAIPGGSNPNTTAFREAINAAGANESMSSKGLGFNTAKSTT